MTGPRRSCVKTFLRTAIPLAMVLALALPANGEACVPVTSNVEVDTGRDAPLLAEIAGPEHHYYVDNDPCPADGSLCLPWIYQESNGLRGLQRDDDFAGDQSCGNPDTLIF